MSDTTYNTNLRDDTTAIFLIGDMYHASLLQASTMINVHEQGLYQFVQRTTLYNADPANIVDNIIQPRPGNLRPILAQAPTATILSVYKINLDAYTSVANGQSLNISSMASVRQPLQRSMPTQPSILTYYGNHSNCGITYSAFTAIILNSRYNLSKTNSTHRSRTRTL